MITHLHTGPLCLACGTKIVAHTNNQNMRIRYFHQPGTNPAELAEICRRCAEPQRPRRRREHVSIVAAP